MESVVSDNFIYETDKRSLDCYQYRTQFLSEGADYGLGDRVRIPIPPINKGFMNLQNTFLKVQVEFPSITGTGLGAHTTRMSHIGINAIFDQVNFLASSGTYIQQMPNYQAITALNLTHNTDLSNAQSNSITNATGIVNEQTGNNIVSGTNFLNVLGNYVEMTSTSETAQVSDQLNTSPSLQGLFSGTRHLPLTWLSSDSALELVLTNDIKNILFSETASSTITGGTMKVVISLSAQIDIVSDNSLRKIEQFCEFGNGPVSWSDTQQRASMNSLTQAELNSTSSIHKTQLITGVRPRKLLSVCQFACRRNTGGNVDPWAIVNPYETFQIRLGAELHPPREMANRAEMTQHALDCYNQNSYTTLSNRQQGGTSDRDRFQLSANLKQSTEVNAVGVNLTQFQAEADGMDTSQLTMETIGSLVVNSSISAGEPYQLYTVKRFGVLYSISPEGDMSISY